MIIEEAPEHQGPLNEPERISVRHMIQVVLSIWNLDKGLLFTLRELSLRPGKAIRDYLFGDRKRYLHPLRFLFLSAALAAFLTTQFVFTVNEFKEGLKVGLNVNNPDGQVVAEGDGTVVTMDPEEVDAATSDLSKAELNGRKIKVSDQEVTEKLGAFVADFYIRYQNLFFLLIVPISALFSSLFFRNNKFYFGEHLAINAFIAANVNVLYIVFIPILIWTDSSEVMVVITILSIIYTLFAYVRVFQRKMASGLFKAALSYGLTLILYTAVVLSFMTIMMLRYMESSGLME